MFIFIVIMSWNKKKRPLILKFSQFVYFPRFLTNFAFLGKRIVVVRELL